MQPTLDAPPVFISTIRATRCAGRSFKTLRPVKPPQSCTTSVTLSRLRSWGSKGAAGWLARGVATEAARGETRER